MPIGQYGPPSDFFPPAPWDLAADVQACETTYGVVPRPDWIRVVYGGRGMQVGVTRPVCIVTALTHLAVCVSRTLLTYIHPLPMHAHPGRIQHCVQ